MKPLSTFYTLLRVVPNQAAGEAVVVGLVLFDGLRYRYEVSERKLKLSFLLARRAEPTLRFAVRQLVARLEADSDVRRAALSSADSVDQGLLLHQADWDYLSRYSNGILRIDEPAPVAFFPGDESETVFQQLLLTLVDAQFQVHRGRQRPVPNASVQALVERVKPRVHTNITLTPSILPDLYFHLRLECIGMNGSLIGAHNLPMEEYSIETLQEHFVECRFALESMSERYRPRKPADNRLYLLADEPDPLTAPDKHKFWRAIRKDKALTVLPTAQAEQVARHIEQTHATRFLTAEAPQQTMNI